MNDKTIDRLCVFIGIWLLIVTVWFASQAMFSWGFLNCLPTMCLGGAL